MAGPARLPRPTAACTATAASSARRTCAWGCTSSTRASRCPGDATTSDSSPNIYGTARIGPDLDQESGQHPADWEYAHFYDPRYVDPLSLMPRFSFLSRQDVIDLTAFVETRSGKVGLLREAGQEWAKKVFLIAGDGNGAPDNKYPVAFDGASLTLAQVAEQNQQGGVPRPRRLLRRAAVPGRPQRQHGAPRLLAHEQPDAA